MAGGLLSVTTQGRHRYYRLASPGVAHALEALEQNGLIIAVDSECFMLTAAGQE